MVYTSEMEAIGSMDYDQAVKNGEIFFGWSTWMEQDGYAPGESIAFDFENGSGTYTYQGKIAGSFVNADTYLVIPEGVYRSMHPRGTAYGYLWVDCDKKRCGICRTKSEYFDF